MRREKYAKLNFNSQNSYYEIVTTMELWMQDRAFLKLEELNTRDSFDTPVTEVNAFYDGSQNRIGGYHGRDAAIALLQCFFAQNIDRTTEKGDITLMKLKESEQIGLQPEFGRVRT
ncbi:hypothetical protein ANCCAN_00184 [Ancylostoma caninum]|uniref:Uncharacterized protein n=1 Tax=Ancylostoma caninum TaxID=29170 RepID=A0A368HE45_ANCCA|nr:hypothetical protein ANCCAN_00184 [Ancylostoma caninum]